MISGRAAAAGALALLASACIGPGDFHCTEHAQCSVRGFCEANGHCSAPDPSCKPSLRRYVHRAGDDADACVPRSCDGHPVEAFSAGGDHACLVRDGNLWCWGRNDRGQLGDGTHTPRPLPVRVTSLAHVSAVAAGDAHTCAVIGSSVMCWGADDLGQLGDGGGSDRPLPVKVNGVAASGMADVSIAAGRDFTCAVLTGGGVSCWGDDSVGQLGDGNAAAGPHPPSAVAGLGDIKSLAAHWQHACALSSSGLLTCWGANSKGQIGDGSTTGPRPPTLVNDPSASEPLPTFNQVTTGDAHTCALAASDIYCWGDNGEGQLNQTGLTAPVPTPTPITGMVTDPIWVAAGGQHTCAVSTVGHVACWGADDSGQHDGTIDNAIKVYAGAAFSCAVANDGALFCWGDNHFGQLAIGGDTVRPTSAEVPNLAHVGAFAAGGGHNCATADDVGGARALFCWGANGSGQVGDGTLTDAPGVVRISTTLQPDGIAAGAAHTCAFPTIDKELRCWGWGASGQLGLAPGSDMVITVPTIKDLVPPVGGDGVFAVATGAAHTCVGATISASVLCFGSDIDGQLGDGQMVAGGPDPVPSFLGKPKALAAGDAHTCALDGKGVIWCWGRGDEGQLGDNTGVGRAQPTMVPLGSGIGSADAVAAGAAHTCALAAGQVLCWGRNAEGQLAAPQPAPLLAPQLVSGLARVKALATGGRHTCVIAGDATVSCWGANESGQLGDGNTMSSNTPVPVAGLTDVDGIAAGGAHSCAHRSDGTVWCWGANTSGQLGDGVTLTSGLRLLARVACE